MTRAFWISAAQLALSGSLAAQAPDVATQAPSPSHARIKPIGEIDPAKLFNERKMKADLTGLLSQSSGGRGGLDLTRLKKMLEENPQLREQALEKLKGINLDDPVFSGMIEEIIRRNNWQVDPELVRQMLQRMQGGSSDGAGVQPMLIPKPKREERDAATGHGPTDGSDPEALRRAWARDIVEWANRFPKDRLATPLRESPALKRLMEELAGAAVGNRPGTVGLDVQLARWQQRWESLKEWLPNDLPDLQWNGIHAPDVHLPKLDLGGSTPASSAAPLVGTIADLLPVLYVAIGVLVAVAVLRMVRSKRSAAANLAAVLGPWPISPGRIESRRQLIRAFDYLAQLRCGPGAKSWHHRAVAACLPRDAAEQSAAKELASLYEWARYSPESGEPPAPALADARRHLAQLAGGAA